MGSQLDLSYSLVNVNAGWECKTEVLNHYLIKNGMILCSD